MSHAIRNAILIVILILAAVWAIVPVERKIRLGKDLSGGVSLVYQVQIGPGESASEVLRGMIPVLKNRVDPQGLFEINFVPMGRDRIEVSMPLPTENVKRLKQAFEDELRRLDASAFSAAELELAMKLEPDARARELDRLASGVPGRRELLDAAAQAYDAARRARAALEEARKAAGDDAAVDEALVIAAADAELAYDAARDRALATVLRAEDVRAALSLSTVERRLINEETGKGEVIPSPRQRALDRLRAANPGAASQLDAVLRAYEAYSRERKTLDDPADLKRLLRGAGVMNFRITVKPGQHPQEQSLRLQLRERGPRNAGAPDAGWFRINDIEQWYNSTAEQRALLADPGAFFAARGYVVEEYDGEYYMLCWDTPTTRLVQAREGEPEWRVASARPGVDQYGRPSIHFEMDPRGAFLLGELTKDHVGDQMAVLLDDEVYTAPNLLSQISRTAQIEGQFSPQEINYIVQVLAAGSLQAKLSPQPISESTLGPELGFDNLMKSLDSGLIAACICAAFLCGYYFFCGVIAFGAMCVNVLLLLAIMSLARAPFSIPGIAGMILSFAMAVDANVLIFERMREEITRNGADLRTAVRLGYHRAMSAIVDGNLTNLLVCIVLYFVGTPEIRGFALTMSIGVGTTLFAQLVVPRVVFELLIQYAGWRRTKMLPIAVPAVQRLFDLNVNWMGLRPAFLALSALLLILSVGVVVSRNVVMLDNEFRGGTAVTLELAADESGRPRTLTRQQVQDELTRLAATAPALSDLRNADVIVIDPQADGVTSSRFQIRTLVTDGEAVQEALVQAFADVLGTSPSLRFTGSDLDDASRAPAFPVLDAVLGESIGRPDVRNDVAAFQGGLAIVLDGIDPPAAVSEIERRIGALRLEPDFVSTLARETRVVPIAGTEQAATAVVVLVRDPDVTFFSDQDRWTTELRDVEWRLVREALTRSERSLSVQSFSPAIARTFAAQAAAAVFLSVILLVIYVWVRFDSARFGVAAIVATMHDCVLAVGLIGLAEIIHDEAPSLAQALGILPFKIDLTVVAALLTILGYSINDKIVVLDRIRENRGKLSYVTVETINLSINQTFSRTIMTGMTTILSTLVLYLVGGEAVRAFAYTLGLGIIIGTYSSIAIAAPLVRSRSPSQAAPVDGTASAPVQGST